MIYLRDYQHTFESNIHAAWETCRAVLGVCPTGGGKTVVFSSIIHGHNGAAAAVVHRKEIVGQISQALGRLGVVHRVVAPKQVITRIRRRHLKEFGKSFVDPGSQVGVVSVQTMTSKSSEKDKDLQRWLGQVTLTVLDECFTAGTLVDGRPIETIRVGDYVTAFNEGNNTFEKRKVTHVFKNAADHNLMVRICFGGHHSVVSTLTHPFYTQRGWVEAWRLNKNDQVLYVSERSGRDETTPENSIQENGPGVLQQGVQQGLSVFEDQRGCVENQQEVRQRANEAQQPDAQGRRQGESVGDVKSDRPRADGARRERAKGDGRRNEAAGYARGARVYGPANSAHGACAGRGRVADPLQDRLREPSVKDSDRSRRAEPLFSRTAGTGQEERSVSAWVGVDSVTFLEPGDTGHALSRTGDGYTYNLEVDGLHTYVANNCVVHNCHHYIKTGLWNKALEALHRSKILGVTATPERADGKGLGSDADGFADTMVEGPTTRWLIEQGYLSRFKYLAPSSNLDVTGVPLTASGDLNTREMRKRVVESDIVGDVVAQYQKHAAGKRAIVFATDVKTAEEIAASFRQAGVTCEALSGETDAGDRDRALDKFEDGTTQVLVNVDLFDEGFDVPGVDCVIMARPTESLAKFLQMVGRALRVVYAKGHNLDTKDGRLAALAAGTKPFAIIIDMVRNWERHGMPDWPRQWTLDGRPKGTRGKSYDLIPQRICDECTQPYEKFYKACPHCGAPIPEPAGRSSPDQVDGDLVELDVEGMAALLEQIGKANRTPEEFEADLIARHVPKIGRPRLVRKHKEALYRRKVLDELIAWWYGAQRQLGRTDSEINRRFFYRFGVDVGTAQTLSADDTDALASKIQQRFCEDMQI